MGETTLYETIIFIFGFVFLFWLGVWLLMQGFKFLSHKSREACQRYHWTQLEDHRVSRPGDMTEEELIEALEDLLKKLKRRRIKK